MLYNLHCYIDIENPATNKRLDLTMANQVEIHSTWKNLTDTCQITLPRRLRFSEDSVSTNINDVFARGSKVKVWLGYNGDLRLEFVGYIARVDARVPFKLECEDEMWKLKQSRVNHTFRNATLKDIIGVIWPGKAKIMDFTVGAYRINNATPAAVLQDLRKMNVFAYFTYDEQPVLNVSFGGYDIKQISDRHVYNFMGNVVSNDLVYRQKDELMLRVVATSTVNGVMIRSEYGDIEGEERKLENIVGMPKKDLDRLARSEFDRLKYNGYRGTLTGFGIPHAQHNDAAVLIDPEYPERDGVYLIDEVKQTFGVSGYRRQLTLGVKIE